jgi:DNA polymerase elongation subunit (family B)
MSIKAVTAGYLKDDKIWYMGPDGEVGIATIGVDLERPYIYSDVKLSSPGIVGQQQQTIRILKQNEIKEHPMWKVELTSPIVARSVRKKATFTAEDDIVYLERRLGADGEIEWVPPNRVSFMDIESDRKTGALELIGSVLDGKYESFKTAESYFQAMQDEKVAAATAWNGDKYDFKILDALGSSPYWHCMRHIDSMELYAKFTTHKTRRGLDVVSRREGIGRKLNPETDGLLAYNENDCRIMEGVIKKLDLIGTEYELAKLTGIMPSPMNLRAIAMFENYLMKNRSKYNLWLEGNKGFHKDEDSIQGALVLYGVPGIYDGVNVLDYTSLYPSVVIYNDYHGDGEQVWKVTQQLAREWVALKEESGKQGRKTQREAYKVLANGSGYGIFASSGFRYSNRSIASYITHMARKKLMELRKIVEDMGFVPLVSDTDSCAIQIPESKADSLLRVINKRVAPFVVKNEYYASRFIVFGGGKDGEAIKKRYAALAKDDELIVKGLEMVRNDWSPWARDFQQKLLMVMLHAPYDQVGERLNEAVRAEEEAFFGGKVPLDDLAITKSIDTKKQYKVKAQHLKAYEQLEEKSVGVIGFVAYWQTKKAGPVVRNGRTDEEIRKVLDLKFVWSKQGEPIVKRLKTCLPIEVTLEEKK